MKVRDVVGKRIVAIRQERVATGRGKGWCWDVQAIELEDGTVLILDTVETEFEYCHNLIVTKKNEDQP